MAVSNIPDAPVTSFQDLQVSEKIYKAVSALGWEAPTPIQSLALPALLGGKDIVGLAQTGSGKTAAFAIPLIERVDHAATSVQALVLVPTRELATQVSKDIIALSRFKYLRTVLLCGGMGMGPQLNALANKAQVVVGTPGRILDHLQRGSLNLGSAQYVVLDEADRMLDMGFAPDVKRILLYTAQVRQTALFSATMPAEIRGLVSRYMHSPEWLTVGSETRIVDTIEQVYYHVADRDKTDGLRSLIDAEQDPRVLVFRRTQYGAVKLRRQLERTGYRVGMLHGGMTQGQRTRALEEFRRGQTCILVATNVAARGLDIPDVSHVINYDIPEDTDTYIHRIGRTARAGRAGIAATLVGESDIRAFESIRRSLPSKVEQGRLSIYSAF